MSWRSSYSHIMYIHRVSPVVIALLLIQLYINYTHFALMGMLLLQIKYWESIPMLLILQRLMQLLVHLLTLTLFFPGKYLAVFPPPPPPGSDSSDMPSHQEYPFQSLLYTATSSYVKVQCCFNYLIVKQLNLL